MAANLESDEITAINITPLVDIVLVLLIIFMVSTSFVMTQTIEIDVPKPAAEPASTTEPPLMLILDSRGALFIDGVEFTREHATPKLHSEWTKNNAVRAVINADTSLDYGEVVKLIDLVRGAGITHFAMAK